MGSQSAKFRRWLLLLVALVLVLRGGTFPRVEAPEPNYPKLPTGIKVEYGPQTPPEEPGIVCESKSYVIRASPYVDDLNSHQRQFWLFNNNHGTVSVSSALRGKIDPLQFSLKVYESPARFTYEANDTGVEGLQFHATIPAPEYDLGLTKEWAGWFQTADANFG